jgi:acyl carrier protein
MSNLKHISTLAVTQSHGAEDVLHVPQPDDRTTSALELELAELIVATLNLDVAAVDIDPNAPLYREGLGLDSIDVLELALAISKKYGLNLRSDDENNLTIFSSLRSLNTHIQQHRSK